MDIGKQIKEIRIKKNMKQSELANKAGVSRMTITNIENGKHKGTFELVLPICNALEITPTFLFTGEEITNELGLSPEGEKLYREYLTYLQEKHPKIEKYEKIENL